MCATAKPGIKSHSKTSIAVGVVLMGCLLGPRAVAQSVLRVSPDGPLRSVADARDEIRRQRGRTPDQAFRVLIADGVYSIEQPIVFGHGDGNVVYEADTGAKPIVSAGRRITSRWTQGANGVWSTNVPRDWHFEQLWVNGSRATRAREPDQFFYYLLRVDQEPEDQKGRFRQTLHGRPGETEGLAGLTAEEIRRVQFVAFHKWDTTRRYLDHADPMAGRLVSSGREMKSWNPLTHNTGYQLENYLAALDQPGEWFLSPDGVLSYLPRKGEVMGDAEVIAPVCEQILIIQGDPANDRTVRDLEFKGITFQNSGWTSPPEGFEPSQAASPIEAAVQVDGAHGIAFRNCEIGHVGGYGIWFRRGCRDGLVQRCLIQDLGAGGVRIGETVIASNESEQTSHITVDNNIVFDGGHTFPCAVGIWIGQSGDNQVTHNEIADFYYTGISVGWRWGYAESLAKRNQIRMNHIHHLGQGYLSDMGGIYTLGPSEGTVLSGNVIHDIESWGYGGWGLYNDEGSSDILLENNLVYRTKSGGYHQHYGRDNRIRNNIFAFGREYQVRRSKVENHRSFTFEQNIVLFESGDLFHGQWGDDKVTVQQNLYWNSSGQVDITPGDRSKTSVVADPRFVDPQNDDFHFVDTTAAKRIGFQPFDWTRAGVYGDEEWRSLAKSLPMPSMDQPPVPPPLELHEDFESGILPIKSRVSVDGNLGGVAVVDVDQAHSGKKVLRLTDTAGQRRRYYPMMVVSPHHVDGITRCRFFVRLDDAAVFQHEWRDASQRYQTGPSLWFENGRLRTPTKELMKIPSGQWIEVDVMAKLGDNAGTWAVTVKSDGVPTRTFDNLPIVTNSWKTLDWVGFVSQADADSTVDIDDLEIICEAK
ncbi:hypothetical protein Mal65_12070 [Crateriforma conspicua]|nr:hypothetical protein Mal65_12070 [Crateriforma conspicua]